MSIINQLVSKDYVVTPFVQVINGNTIAGYLFSPIPSRFNNCLIIACHGGFALAKENDVASYADAAWYAKQGFGIFLIKYDQDSIQGMRTTTLMADVREVRDAAIIFSNKFPRVKIFLMGTSRGSFVSQWAMILYGGMFRAGAHLVGPTFLPDFFSHLRARKIFPEVTVGNNIGLDVLCPYFDWSKDKVLSSTVSSSDQLKLKPALLIYGLTDQVVPWQQGQMLADGCGLTRDKNFFLLDGGHGLGMDQPAMQIVGEFFLTN
jgi:dipeptidyl aminopeptidase/acylaminoacyl peptidase